MTPEIIGWQRVLSTAISFCKMKNKKNENAHPKAEKHRVSRKFALLLFTLICYFKKTASSLIFLMGSHKAKSSYSPWKSRKAY